MKCFNSQRILLKKWVRNYISLEPSFYQDLPHETEVLYSKSLLLLPCGKAMWTWPAFSKRNALVLPKAQILCFPEIVSNDAGQSAVLF